MNVRIATVWTLLRHELRMIVRDRRSLLTALIVPILVMPLIFFVSSFTRNKREATLRATTYKFAVTGDAHEQARVWVNRALEMRRTEGKGTNLLRFREHRATNALAELHAGVVHVVAEGIPESFTNSAGEVSVDNTRPPLLKLVFRADRDDSVKGMHAIVDAVDKFKTHQREALLQARGFPFQVEELAVVKAIDLASGAQVAGLTLGKLITVFLLLLVFSGGAVVATDLLAGEKERGTLETLLTSSASRAEIITSKQLAIISVAAVITLLQVLNLLVYVGFNLIAVPANLAAAVTPGKALLLLFLFLPTAALVASVLLLTSGVAKTYKEAQMYFLPALILTLLPGLTPIFPDLPLRSAVVLIPIANIGLAVKEIMVGVFDWPMIGLAWLVTAASAVWITWGTIRLLSAERLMAAGNSDELAPGDGHGRFSRHVLAWFGMLWAVVWIVNSYTARQDIRVQLIINLVVLFLGASIVMLVRYRLNWREALSWRMPKPMVWVGVICVIPGGLLTASGLARLTGEFLPVSDEMLEEFARAIVPEGITLAEMLIFLGLLPAFCEEIAFRGLLLHGLRKCLHPVALALVVGLIFGLFHFALFRIAGTAFLGVLLAAVTLMTGSLLPAMVWHAGNNALGVIAAKYEVPVGDLEPWIYFAGAGLLAAGFWVFWRARSPGRIHVRNTGDRT